MVRRLALAAMVALMALIAAATSSGATARATAQCGCVTGGPPPPPAAKQAVSICQSLKLPHNRGWVSVYYGYYTTSCPAARRVVATFWPRSRQIHGEVGTWRCTRYPHWRSVICHGPRRQYASGSWSPQNWPHA